MLLNEDMFIACAKEAGLIVPRELVKDEDYTDSIIQRITEIAVAGGNFLGCGIGRTVYGLGNFVIKVARSIVNEEEDDWDDNWYYCYDKSPSATFLDYSDRDDGMKQNRNEAEFVQLCGKFHADNIAAVYATSSNYAVSICERCHMVPMSEWTEEENERYEHLGQQYQDLHEFNVAFNNKGRMVVIDLGFMQPAATNQEELDYDGTKRLI